MDNVLKYLCWVDNTADAQIKLLFELCDCDLEKLMLLLAIRKKHNIVGCPSDKETVEEMLLKPLY